MTEQTSCISTSMAIQSKCFNSIEIKIAPKLFNQIEIALKTIDKISTVSRFCSQVATVSMLIDQITTKQTQLEQSKNIQLLSKNIDYLQDVSLHTVDINNFLQNISAQIDKISNIANIYNNIEAIQSLIPHLNIPSEDDLLTALSGIEQKDYEQKLRESFEAIDQEHESNHNILSEIEANQFKRLSETIFKMLVIYSVFQQAFGLPTIPELLNEITVEVEEKNSFDPQTKFQNCFIFSTPKTGDNNKTNNDDPLSNNLNNAVKITSSHKLRIRKCNKKDNDSQNVNI